MVVLSGDASDGIARQFIDELALLRPGVTRLGGNEVAVRRDVSLLSQSTTVVVIDVRRYDQLGARHGRDRTCTAGCGSRR